MREYSSDYITGKAPLEATRIHRSLSEKEKVELWFIDPLINMKGDEAFICLMICFPLLETIMRFELGVADTDEVKFSDNAKALHWFAKFMTIPDKSARDIWDAFRNGLLHRAMIEFKDDRVTIFVWDLRKAVVNKLREHHKRLWKESAANLPAIYLKA